MQSFSSPLLDIFPLSPFIFWPTGEEMAEDYKCGEGRQPLPLLLSAEEKKLELRLGLPGGEGWSTKQKKRESPAEASRVCKRNSANASSAAKRVFLSPVDSKTQGMK